MSQREVSRKIPVIFQKLKEYDTRFLRVKIWLMHTGLNYNWSVFSKEAVEGAIDSLMNTPILGYIEENKLGEEDFSDHRSVIVREDGEFKERYIGQAFGVIPADNNAKFELRVGDDGVEREYLTVEGLIWTKWDKPVEILNNSDVKGQSMELHNDYEGYFDQDGLFHFTKFKFFGACILGDDVQPAMNRSTVEKFSIEKEFSYDAFQREANEKLEEFKNLYSQHQTSSEDDDIDSNKEDEAMDKSQLLEQFSITVEQLQEKGIDFEALTYEELEAKLQEVTAQDDQDNPDENFEAPVVCEKCNEETCACVNDDDANDDEDKVPPVEDFSATIANLQSSLDEVTKERDNLLLEVETLRDYKNQKETSERQEAENELYEQFSTQLTEEELDEVKKEASTMTIDQLKKELFALVGMKNAKFSTKKQEQKPTVKVNLDNSDSKDGQPSYMYILEKVKK